MAVHQPQVPKGRKDALFCKLQPENSNFMVFDFGVVGNYVVIYKTIQQNTELPSSFLVNINNNVELLHNNKVEL